jgi:GT2 family glycosyltransferase
VDISFIIVNYYHARELARCLGSVQGAVGEAEHEVIVVDNSGNDPHLDEVQAQFPQVRFIVNRTNAGFATANNQGAQSSRGRFLLFLNPDTELEAGSVASMLDHLQTHPEIGVLAPKVLNSDGTLQYSCRRFPSLWTGLFNRYSLLTRLFPDNRVTGRYLMTDFDHNEVRPVDWVSGCCMMIPRTAFMKVGLFDENYFLFNEDVDLCKSMHQAGFDVVYFPGAWVIHRITSSNGRLPTRLIIKRHRGMSYYQRKHMNNGWFLQNMIDLMIGVRCCSHLILKVFRP